MLYVPYIPGRSLRFLQIPVRAMMSPGLTVTCYGIRLQGAAHTWRIYILEPNSPIYHKSNFLQSILPLISAECGGRWTRGLGTSYIFRTAPRLYHGMSEKVGDDSKVDIGQGRVGPVVYVVVIHSYLGVDMIGHILYIISRLT